MAVIERARVPKSITRTYCAKRDCDGEGFYSARCQSAGHATEDVEYVPASQLRGAVEALREIGALGGPLYLLNPNQGERPDPVAAGEKLREIMARYHARGQ